MLDDQNLYAEVGGETPFFELVNRFYEHVENAPTLRRLYPADLAPGKQHLAWFLIQRFGGPAHFNEKRGAPMLRRRHAEFAIDRAARDLWFAAMMGAVDDVPELAAFRALLETYFADAATFLINRTEQRSSGQVLL